jgi:hypothetical protein
MISTDEPVTAQGRAYRVLGQLLERAATEHLPAIDWTVIASGSRVLGRCTAFPGPRRRRADFEAWRAELGAEAGQGTATADVPRLTARAEREHGLVTVEIVADLYDDPDIEEDIEPAGAARPAGPAVPVLSAPVLSDPAGEPETVG